GPRYGCILNFDARRAACNTCRSPVAYQPSKPRAGIPFQGQLPLKSPYVFKMPQQLRVDVGAAKGYLNARHWNVRANHVQLLARIFCAWMMLPHFTVSFWTNVPKSCVIMPP